MRKIITTCGTSLFESCCWKKFGSQEEDLNSRHLSKINNEDEKRADEYNCRKAFNKFIEDKKEISTNGIYEIPQKSIKEVAENFDKFSWYGSAKDKDGNAKDNFEYLRDLPAELASLRAIEHVLLINKEPFTKDDEILLLCSDTTDGKFCAAVIKEVLTIHKLVPCAVVNVETITGLDFEEDKPQDNEIVGNAHINLWNNFFAQQPDDTDYIFNLTGGYKSLVILLGAVAYTKSEKAIIFYLNEKSKRDKILIMWFDTGSRPNPECPWVSGCITEYCKISECTHERNRLHKSYFDK